MDKNFRFNIEKIRFETDVEKKYHKLISSMHSGETLEIKVGKTTPESRKEIKTAIKKSAVYNGITVKASWIKEDTVIKVSHEW